MRDSRGRGDNRHASFQIDRNLREKRVRKSREKRCCAAALQVDAPQRMLHFLAAAGNDRPAVGRECEIPHTAPPLRAAVFGFAMRDLPDFARDQVAEVDMPPAGLVADIGQIAAVRRKRRLHHRNLAAARQHFNAHDFPPVVERQHVYFAAIPRHIRMVPDHHRQMPAVGMPHRIHYEVAWIVQFAGEVLPAHIHNRQPVLVLVGVAKDDIVAVG